MNPPEQHDLPFDDMQLLAYLNGTASKELEGKIDEELLTNEELWETISDLRGLTHNAVLQNGMNEVAAEAELLNADVETDRTEDGAVEFVPFPKQQGKTYRIEPSPN